MTVLVQTGSGRIPTGTAPANYGYLVFHDTSAGESVTISTAAASPRIDYIVAYVDKGVTGSTIPANVNNTNNVLKFAAVAGTPAGSPVPPTTTQINTAIGAANPYIILGQVAVGASVTQITTSNITDKRKMIAPTMGAGSQIKAFVSRTSSATSGSSGTPVPYNGLPGPYTFNAIKGKTYRISLFEPNVTQSTASGPYNATIGFIIGGTPINTLLPIWYNQGVGQSVFGEIFWTAPSTGSFDLTINFSNTGGATGTWTFNATATGPAQLVIEELA